MQFTEQELNKLIENLEKTFGADLAKAEEAIAVPATGVPAQTEVLAKAEEEKKEEKPAESKEEAKPENKEAKPEDKEEKPESKEEAPAAEAKPEDKEAAAPESKEDAPAAPAAEGDDACDYDDEDHAHMNSMYASMSKGELRAHHDAVKNALDSKGMAKCGEMAMTKSETTETVVEVKTETPVQQPSNEMELLKSEFEATKAKAEGLQKNLDAVTEFLTKLVKKSAPQGKAITNMEVITKSEETVEEKPLTKSEIGAILTKKSADPSLSKNDRELINAYYLNGASINTISHLLK